MKVDDRNKNFEDAILLNKANLPGLKINELVKVTGIISDKNSPQMGDFVLASKENKVKRTDRSLWITSESYVGDILISNTEGLELTGKISGDYIPCGSNVEIVQEKKDSKERLLGIKKGVPITGYGKIASLNPLIVDLGSSPCVETIEVYSGSLEKKFPGYVLAILFLAVPSLFLIYLGIYGRRTERDDSN